MNHARKSLYHYCFSTFRRVKRHNDDCLCAICTMVRRRQEREYIMNPAGDQIETSDGLVQEVKPEVSQAL